MIRNGTPNHRSCAASASPVGPAPTTKQGTVFVGSTASVIVGWIQKGGERVVKEAGVVVASGVNERDGETLYNTQLLFDAD
jgi:hypothetical protein